MTIQAPSNPIIREHATEQFVNRFSIYGEEVDPYSPRIDYDIQVEPGLTDEDAKDNLRSATDSEFDAYEDSNYCLQLVLSKAGHMIMVKNNEDSHQASEYRVTSELYICYDVKTNTLVTVIHGNSKMAGSRRA